MADEKPDQYSIEPEPESSSPADEAPPARAAGSGIPRPAQVEPLKIEDDDDPGQPSPRTVKDLDVCPSCGAPMRGQDKLLCMRCGFNLKTMRHETTRTGETTVTAVEPNDELVPIIKPGNGALWLPTIIAAISGSVLLVGYFAGVRALYPDVVAQTPADQVVVVPFMTRVDAVLRLLVLVGMLKACGLGALTFVAYLNGKRLAKNWDDLKLGGVRMLAIVVTMRLAAFIALPHRGLEVVSEALVQLVVFALLSMALFRLPSRDVPILAGAMAILFILLWLAGWVIVWATW